MVLVFKFLFLNSWVTLLIKQNLERYGNVRNISPCQQRRRQAGGPNSSLGTGVGHRTRSGRQRGGARGRPGLRLRSRLCSRTREAARAGGCARGRGEEAQCVPGTATRTAWPGPGAGEASIEVGRLGWGGPVGRPVAGVASGLKVTRRHRGFRVGLRGRREAAGRAQTGRGRADGPAARARGAKGWGAGSGPAGGCEKTTLDARGRSDRKFSFM